MDCNLELGLSSSSTTFSTGSNVDDSKREQLTIFYNGTICVCDVTEAQARCIINRASRKMTEGTCISPTDQISPKLQYEQLCSQTQNGLSMKKSLRQFLEKRRHRIKATSPYYPY
ncbi:protein TIFY 5A-like isoform X2 [Chenopodium quinoa]|uniref:protein TIFY 5A-like isoform X2 n=1 Tax=Chenopodium quinoa TaxID=63459 RepID=UPI000B787528|nr:protein TIFY 5A-like isoform X2 [Chenopodium quinoa]